MTNNDHLLQKKIAANKELHEKVGVLSGQLKEVARKLSETTRKNLSLQNENEYLIRKVSKTEEKHQQRQQEAQSAPSLKDRESELVEMKTLKDAFSRRCEELKT